MVSPIMNPKGIQGPILDATRPTGGSRALRFSRLVLMLWHIVLPTITWKGDCWMVSLSMARTTFDLCSSQLYADTKTTG